MSKQSRQKTITSPGTLIWTLQSWKKNKVVPYKSMFLVTEDRLTKESWQQGSDRVTVGVNMARPSSVPWWEELIREVPIRCSQQISWRTHWSPCQEASSRWAFEWKKALSSPTFPAMHSTFLIWSVYSPQLSCKCFTEVSTLPHHNCA